MDGGCLTSFTGWGLGGAIGGGGGGAGGKDEASLSDTSDDDGDGVGSLTTKEKSWACLKKTCFFF